jgi:hypothetical protein
MTLVQKTGGVAAARARPDRRQGSGQRRSCSGCSGQMLGTGIVNMHEINISQARHPPESPKVQLSLRLSGACLGLPRLHHIWPMLLRSESLSSHPLAIHFRPSVR